MKLPSSILAAVLAGSAVLASANAADMYSPAAGGFKDGLPYAGINWSGFYLGAHVGGVWGTDAVDDTNADWCAPSQTHCSYNNDATGAFGGGQLGYNFQIGHFVFGPEVDLGYMDLSHTQVAPGFTSANSWASVDGGFYLTATGRLGYSFDKALLYAKGGYAYYGGNVSNYSSDVPETLQAGGLGGWTAGGGIEYKIAPSWSVKAEYLHFDFGSATNVFPPNLTGPDAAFCNPNPCPITNSLTADSVKVGVNYFVHPSSAPLK